MTPCARSCCWNPWNACSRQRSCRCHAADWLAVAVVEGWGGTVRADPTAWEAIYNIEKERRGR